jgi:hypothetical protein
VERGYWPLPSTVYSIGFEVMDTGAKVVLLANTNVTAAVVTVKGGTGGTLHGARFSADGCTRGVAVIFTPLLRLRRHQHVVQWHDAF